MEYVSHISIIFCILIIVLSARIIPSFLKINDEHGKYKTIDGLRGYIGVIVFLHHACTWYFYNKNGKWQFTPIDLYTTLGQASVMLMFMVTGFLFFGKITKSKYIVIDWKVFFLRRLFRLTPLYFFSVTILIILIAIKSDFKTQSGLAEQIPNVINWFLFTLFSAPVINDVKDTSVVIAGVTWTLPYEWFYYFLLPGIAVLFGSVVPKKYIAAPILAILYYFWHQLHYAGLVAFLAGMLSVYVIKIPGFLALSISRKGTTILLISIFFLGYFFKTAYELLPIIVIFVIFCLIAGGNSLMGILTTKSAAFLGQIGYSIYLLHGLLLYLVFSFILSNKRAFALSPIEHWGVVLATSPVLIVISAITYKIIERPPMIFLEKLTSRN